MEKKPSSLAFFYLFIFTHFFNIFTINRASAQKTPIPIKVGVVLDMDSYLGQMGLNCISIALSDFYATKDYCKTRLVLIERDSKKDVVAAAAAGTQSTTPPPPQPTHTLTS
ncbi:hypothetical protein CDL12_24411 [Handroanthus impetiginosus]|uniref:Receptor ligand binding region domain-containing protein n=1 Tax=Handroanthus impetiginosus TaxID=429701 RepID=A0A2G9GCQ6_9LAMI|nr:hypothetical protein CDL12_24411 [Handroanthus impetiginosus]